MDIYDPEDLIAAVKKRPLLYDKFAENYNDRTAKYSSWMQVAQEVTENWNDLDVKDKELRAREVQSKWRNMRDNFRREITDKQITSNGIKKKTKYRYFQQLIFLLPQFQNKDSNKSKTSAMKDNDREISENSLTNNKRRVRRYPVFRSVPNKIRRTQEPTVNLIQPKATNSWTEENEVRDFCRSLVPSLSKLDDEDRLSAKIEILNVLRRFSTPKHLRINNATINDTQTFNTFQQSSNIESIHSQINPLSPLQSVQDSPIQNLNHTTSASLLPYNIDISHIKSDINDN
ncbi:hypothetical protein RR48_07960 [Papilio machaon]|uniref:MADF domain-containing protein n=1 Tax=Papilio machaon TaxID=76193 RepID=A0A194QNL3_PAPMA|nr:hypothetical protein RR48_07960 [Papilio machaon]